MTIGDRAPAISLTATDGSHFNSQEAVSRGPLVIAFFPLAFTPG